MREEQRYRALHGGSLVDEVHVQPVDDGLEVIELVEFLLLGSPIEFVLPVFY